MTTIDAAFDDDLRGPSWVIRIIGLTVVAFIVWASFAWVDEIVRSEGEFVSSSRPQIIQNFEGGILSELLVAEGDTVNPGDILARLSVTNFQTSVDDLQDQVNNVATPRDEEWKQFYHGITMPGPTSCIQCDQIESEELAKAEEGEQGHRRGCRAIR